MSNEILILGSGGFAKEVAFLLEDINRLSNKNWEIKGYIDKEENINKSNGKYNVIFNDDDIINLKNPINLVIGLGNPKIVSKVVSELKKNQLINFPNIIHPNVIGDFERIKLGEGNIITSNNIFTTDIKIGSFNIFNLNCTIGHDCVIGNFNIFNPGINISGGVQIGDKNLIGTGAQILQYLEIGSNSVIGAGAVVAKNIPSDCTAVGIPAKPIKFHSK